MLSSDYCIVKIGARSKLVHSLVCGAAGILQSKKYIMNNDPYSTMRNFGNYFGVFYECLLAWALLKMNELGGKREFL